MQYFAIVLTGLSLAVGVWILIYGRKSYKLNLENRDRLKKRELEPAFEIPEAGSYSGGRKTYTVLNTGGLIRDMEVLSPDGVDVIVQRAIKTGGPIEVWPSMHRARFVARMNPRSDDEPSRFQFGLRFTDQEGNRREMYFNIDGQFIGPIPKAHTYSSSWHVADWSTPPIEPPSA